MSKRMLLVALVSMISIGLQAMEGSSGIDPEQLVEEQWKAGEALYKEAYHGNIFDMQKHIEAAGAYIDFVGPGGDTPLIQAVRLGNLAAAYLLLINKSNVNQRVSGQETALHIASQKADAKMVRLLLDFDADSSLKAKFGEMPLDFARGVKRKEAEEVVKILESKLVNQYFPGKGIRDAGRALNTQVGQKLMNVPDELSPMRAGELLYQTLGSGDILKIANLLDDGAVVDWAAPNGDTPLIKAVRSKDLAEALLLLKNKAYVDRPTLDRKKQRFSPLHIAAQNGDSKMVRLLLDFGADPYVKSKAGKLPLDFAKGLEGQEKDQIMQALEEKMADKYVPGKGQDDAVQDLNKKAEIKLELLAKHPSPWIKGGISF